ncbi:hypothetical protein [Jatrophihabitans sp.]|uniref:hypothetical protein n=1 Tax=Jatrophihabitans sp. TaxID=1932789 RepID=UPI0030C7210D|nr:hypothetical protein [Jatrophihabitans sp.]
MAEQEWTPTFEGQRPPFQPGHELSTKHGAYSPRKVNPLAKDLIDMVLVDPDPTVEYLRAAVFRPALWAWARAEAQVQLLAEYLGDTVGDLEAESVLSAYLLLHRAEGRAHTQRQALGMTPMARARLGRDVAQGKAATSVTAVMAELHRLEAEGKLLPAAGVES